MEYYSAIKKNTSESVLMRWMKLEPIIQSEISQKEKHQYSISSVQFSLSVVSDSLWPHESQHARIPVHRQLLEITQTPVHRVGDAIQPSSIVPFSSCPQSLPASGSFPMSQLFAWGGQSMGVSASASVLPMNIQDWSPLGWTANTVHWCIYMEFRKMVTITLYARQ